MTLPERPTDGSNAAAVPRVALVRYRLRFRSRSGTQPRGFLGSAWRGAFGHALRHTVCITGLPPSCDGCALLASCVYPRTFESRPPADAKKLKLYPTAPNPYVLEPAGDGDAKDGDTKRAALHLGLTLFGPANDDAPTALQALQRAGRDGLTNARVALDFVDAQAERFGADSEQWTPVQSADAGMAVVSAQEPRVPPAPPVVRVQLLSPLRIRGGGRYVGPSEFNFRTFAANLLRRFSLLTYFFGQAPLEVDFAGLLREAEGVPLEDVQLRWRELSRRSSRQRTTIQMGGLVGAFTVRGPQLALFWPCLWLGQWTHIGKGCTMGLGRYVLVPPGEAGNEPWQGPKPL